MRQANRLILSSLALGATLSWAAAARAVSVPTGFGSGLDEQATESAGSTTPSVNGSSDTANARFNPGGPVNEFIVLRFDLSGVDKSTIADAAVNLIANRTSGNNEKPQRIWGINPSAAGFNTFAEGDSSVPGLAFDGDQTTQDVVDADTTFLGRFQFDSTTDPNEGGTFVLNDALLSASSEAVENTLDGYLQSLGNADQAVFLIGGAGASNGQFRVETKEATSTSTGVLTGNAGDLAPTLTYSVPEPGSLALLGLGGLVALRRRRVR